MKTFLEFIAEAELVENDQQEFAKLRAEIKMLQRRGRPGDDEKIKELVQRVAELQMKAQSETGAELNKDKPKPEKKIPGRGESPQKPKDVVSRVGTSSNIRRTDIPQELDVIHKDRFSSPGSSGGRGTNISRTGGTYGTKG